MDEPTEPRKFDARKRHISLARGDVGTDAAGRIKEPASREEWKNHGILASLRKACSTQAGWLEDGEGPGYRSEDWEWLIQGVRDHFPDSLPSPCVSPTARGTVSFFWDEAGALCSVDFYAESKTCEIIAMKEADTRHSDVLRLPCSSPDDWRRFFHAIKDCLTHA